MSFELRKIHSYMTYLTVNVLAAEENGNSSHIQFTFDKIKPRQISCRSTAPLRAALWHPG